MSSATSPKGKVITIAAIAGVKSAEVRNAEGTASETAIAPIQ